jgi:hypothetical protein
MNNFLKIILILLIITNIINYGEIRARKIDYVLGITSTECADFENLSNEIKFKSKIIMDSYTNLEIFYIKIRNDIIKKC